MLRNNEHSDFTSETLALTKEALAKALSGEDLGKAFVQSPVATQGLTQYSLEGPAKTLYPLLTPLRNMLPRSSGAGMGIQANWRAITGINITDVQAGIGEGNRGGVISTRVEDYNAAFKGIGLDDSATFEAVYAGETYEDVQARMSQGLLRSVMRAEEDVLMGAVGTFDLGRPAAPVLSLLAEPSSIPGGTTVSVSVVGLTMAGYRRGRVPGAATPVLGLVQKTNADGSIDEHGGFSTRASAEVSLAVPAGNSLRAVVPAMRGACGYAWFVRDAAGSQATARLFAVTQTNSALVNAVPSTTQQLGADLAANDRSRNHLLHDGLLGIAARPGFGSYWHTMPTGTAGRGTPLTADGTAGVAEIDEALAWFWNNWNLGPDDIWVNAEQLVDCSRLISLSGNASAIRFMFNADQQNMVGGRVIQRYINPFSSKAPTFKLHPTLPPGTMIFASYSLPYQASGVTETMRVLCRRDYYQIDWPKRSRKHEIGVYSDQVLQHYAPFSMGVISNIAKLPV